jgi:hypothetical protein
MFDLPLEDRLLEAVALAYIALSRLPESQRSTSDLKAFRELLDKRAGKRKAIVCLAHADTLLSPERDGYEVFKEYGLVQ